ncbi:hypothetical protein [Myroides odoratus]|uniref:hypothetical protein n=1 Tax=Myroides odoratus TaxID=256 RepID=UPI003340ACA4
MKKNLVSFILCSLPILGIAQSKIGIGNENPNSTLTVGGSISGAYREITDFSDAPIHLEATDYYLTYNARGKGHLVLPDVGNGSSSLKGRIYKIKNISKYDVTLKPSTNEKFRNVGEDMQTIVLQSGHYVELICNGKESGTSTWDVSSISLGIPEKLPEVPIGEPVWEFNNIYDYVATNRQLVERTGVTLNGFSKTIVIPPNREAKIVISYSIPLGSHHESGFYGVLLMKGSTELAQGSRKTSVVRSNQTDEAVTSISATVADNIAASTVERRVTYSLKSYLEYIYQAVYLMYDATGENYNWGRGYWSIMVYFKKVN